MLTSDLLSVRVVKKQVRPRYISDKNPELLAMAESLIDTFEGHQGSARQDVEDDLAEILGADTDFMLHRALAKLLYDRCEFEASAVKPAEELRSALFAQAARAYRRSLGDQEGPFRLDRRRVLEETAAELQVEADDLEAGLYSDLKSEQVLTKWRPCKPEWLLRRYNVALAQGVLLRATELRIELIGDHSLKHRELFRKIKFFRLMHRVSRRADGGWDIVLDGPISLFKASGKYGLQMAMFLPTLLHFNNWTLEAFLRWGPKRRPCTFKLGAEDGLRSHTRLTGQWRPEELGWLPEQFDKLKSDWQISTDTELVDLGGEGVLVPDFVFTHRLSGRTIHMEVFGFWRKGAVDSRLKLLRRHGPPNFILAISSALATGREALDDLPVNVYVFRAQPVARKVLKVLDAIGP